MRRHGRYFLLSRYTGTQTQVIEALLVVSRLFAMCRRRMFQNSKGAQRENTHGAREGHRCNPAKKRKGIQSRRLVY
eukprot:3167116-Rhodomonas_salina.1